MIILRNLLIEICGVRDWVREGAATKGFGTVWGAGLAFPTSGHLA